jgi:hypothetical protein
MNRPILFGVVVALLFLTFGCSTISVTTDYNPNFNFSDLKSYAWLDNGQATSDDARINNDQVAGRVRKAVEKNLAARGYVKTEGDSADFMVSWFGAIDKKMQVETIDHFYSPYGYGPLYRDPSLGSSARAPSAYEYEVGTLIIDILDPVEHKLIWRGSGNDRIREQKNPEDMGKGINGAVAAIMKDFPPAK